MEIIEINHTHINQLCLLHRDAFDKAHFSVNFNQKLLRAYFQELIDHFKIKVILYNDNKEAVGYLFGGVNSGQPINKLIKKHRFAVLLTLLKNPRFTYEKIIGFINGLLESGNEFNNVFTVYLIAVSKNHKGKGWGSVLMDYFEKEVIKYGMNSYFLSVRKHNIEAIKFYERKGFRLIKKSHFNYSFLKELKTNG